MQKEREPVTEQEDRLIKLSVLTLVPIALAFAFFIFASALSIMKIYGVF